MAYPGPEHLRIFKARNRPHHLLLHFHRQRGRHAVDVNLVGIQPFRLEEELMLLLIRKPHHLVFNRRAIPRPDAVICPEYIGERLTFSRIMRNVSGVV